MSVSSISLSQAWQCYLDSPGSRATMYRAWTVKRFSGVSVLVNLPARRKRFADCTRGSILQTSRRFQRFLTSISKATSSELT